MDAIESVTALARIVPTTHGWDEEIDSRKVLRTLIVRSTSFLRL
jgi:hypothetical protein